MLLFSVSVALSLSFFIVCIEIPVGKIHSPLRGNSGRAVWKQLNHVSFFPSSSFDIFTYMTGISYL